jgi:hypothetical protein
VSFVSGAAACVAHAGPSVLSQGEPVLARIERERLWLEPAWLSLLAYRKTAGGGWRSQADAAPFFLSPEGRVDPRAEMLATARALFGPGEVDAGDGSVRCRFPARYVWMRRALGLEAGVPVPSRCPALGRWYEAVAADSVTLHFASSYLENPSSVFGHTFLRFDRDGAPVLLAPTSNFEADTSRNRGSVAFLAKGLTGGFPAVAEQLPYYRRLRRYGEIAGRDVWEYPLLLDRGQVELLQLALWEAKDGVFDYFFLGENCSYRVLALLDVVAPGATMVDSFPLETAPVETLRLLDDRGLLGEPEYRPSAVRSLLWHARGFSAAELRAVLRIARGTRRPDDPGNFPGEARARILRAAAEYSSIRIHRGEVGFEERSRLTQSIVAARLALDDPAPADPVPVPPEPDSAHGGRMAMLGWSNRAGVDALEIGVAGFQHERIDRLAGYEKGAEIVALAARARVTGEGDVDLEHAWVFRLESTTASGWLLQHPAWSLRLGAERKHVDNDRPLVGTLAYTRGKAFDVGIGVLALAVGASLDSASDLRAGMAMEAIAEATLTRQDPWLACELFLEHGRYVFGDHSHRVDYGIRLGLPLSRQRGLALTLQRGGAYSEENSVWLELRRFF